MSAEKAELFYCFICKLANFNNGYIVLHQDTKEKSIGCLEMKKRNLKEQTFDRKAWNGIDVIMFNWKYDWDNQGFIDEW